MSHQQHTPEPFGHFKADAFGWTDCAETDEGAQPMYDQAAIDQLGERLMVSDYALKDALRQRDALLADVDRCYKMLLSEPDTQGALFKAENILREAIASAKGGA